MNAYEKVLKSREKGRPTAVKYIGSIVENFIELHGDRRFSDDKAIIGGIGTISGMPVTVIGIEKGDGTADKIAHNFGCAHPEGYRKAVRLMKEAVKGACFVKASGGIKNGEQFKSMLDAGADRVGTSSGVEIAKDLNGK